MKLKLNSEWTITREGQTELKTDMPATQYTVLKKYGLIPDPFFKTNEKDCLWPAECDWEFKKNFVIGSAELQAENIDLCIDRLDTLAKIYVNGILAGEGKNVHVPFRKNIKEFLTAGENSLMIEFASPVEYIAAKHKEDWMPINPNGLRGMQHIRKAGCHFGWDWGPQLPMIGILSDVVLDLYTARFSHTDVKQIHKNDLVTLSVAPQISGLDNIDGLVYDAELYDKDGKLVETQKDITAALSVNIDVINPDLWWSNDLLDKGEKPALYTLKLTLKKDGRVLDNDEKKLGLRTIVLDRNKDDIGTQFRFVVNGVPIFAKGANWIPPDSMPDTMTHDRLEMFIDACLDANMNMIRVWGGGFYETDAFYDLCDERGILVWQDFCFACAPYPFYNDGFLANVKEEVYANIIRLKHRASLAVWCGNNELETMTAGWGFARKLVKWTEIFFYDILPQWVADADDTTAYIQGSPVGTGFLKDVGSDKHGDTHLWQVWHGLRPLNYYEQRYTRFCSEYGLESLPDMHTINAFSGGEDLSLTSPVFMAHQKCNSGNMKMLYYISTVFRLPKKFEDLVYLTQISQAFCVEFATLHWRRNKGTCNGSLYWQLNDCWPVISWSSIDYFGRKKALHYRARHFFAPLSLSLHRSGNNVDFYILNDTRRDFDGSIAYKLLGFDGAVLKEGSVNAVQKGGDCKKVYECDLSQAVAACKNHCVLKAELIECGKVISDGTMLFELEKNLKLPTAKIAVNVIERNDKTATVRFTADAFARFVYIKSAEGLALPDDNYFDLTAGESRDIVFTAPSNEILERELASVYAISVCDIEPKGSRFSDFMTRTKVMLKPMNLINNIFYRLS